MPKITPEEFNEIVEHELPWANDMGMRVETVSQGHAKLRLPFKENSLRPGGTISGPTMMAFADVCMYAVILSAIGKVKMAVTTNFNINFLQLPNPADMIAEGSILKLGKRLAVMEVSIQCEGQDGPVAHATATFSIPPKRD